MTHQYAQRLLDEGLIDDEMFASMNRTIESLAESGTRWMMSLFMEYPDYPVLFDDIDELIDYAKHIQPATNISPGVVAISPQKPFVSNGWFASVTSDGDERIEKTSRPYILPHAWATKSGDPWITARPGGPRETMFGNITVPDQVIAFSSDSGEEAARMAREHFAEAFPSNTNQEVTND